MGSPIGGDGAARDPRPVSGLLVGLVAAALSGCTPAPPAHESAIRSKLDDHSDPAVAAIRVLGMYSWCTATLISHHTVLTTGHCGLGDMEAAFGTNVDQPDQSIPITTVAVYAMPAHDGKPIDVAVMQLASDPVGIAPLPLNAAPLTDADLGHPIRHVGFGATSNAPTNDSGIKHSVRNALDRIDTTRLRTAPTDDQSCLDDSGGPGLMTLGAQATETVVSVVSWGPDCDFLDDGSDDRVDTIKDWIIETVSAWDAPPTFGPPGSTGSGAGSGANGGPDGGGDDGDHGRATAVAGCSAGPGTLGGPALSLLALAWLRRRRRALS